MARDGRAEQGGASVVTLTEATTARRGADAPQPASRNQHFERLLCRAVAERLLVELRYDSEIAPRLFTPHLVYR
jgi:hypothetical protein